MPRKGRDWVVIVDIPYSSSIDNVADVYDKHESEEVNDSLANEGETAPLVLRREKRPWTEVPMSVFKP